MKNNDFLQLIAAEKPLLADGAMGTLLHERGISFEACFDELNLSDPRVVGDVHREYIEAGAQIILTNTFGANTYKLRKHGMVDKLHAINTAGVELARRIVMASFKDVLIAGDIGPLGVRLAPFGRVLPEEARRIFSEQVKALLEADIDLLIFETMTDLYEIREAIHAAKALSPIIPIVASMTFTRDDRTLLGDNPRKVAKALKMYGADVIGINCSGGPNQLLRILREMRSVLPNEKYWVKPNAGWPEQMGGRIFYPASPDYFGDYARSFWKAGVDVIGGCCGTTPGHIAAMRKSLDSEQSIEPNGIKFQSAEIPMEEKAHLKPTRLARKLNKGTLFFSSKTDTPINFNLGENPWIAASIELISTGRPISWLISCCISFL